MGGEVVYVPQSIQLILSIVTDGMLTRDGRSGRVRRSERGQTRVKKPPKRQDRCDPYLFRESCGLRSLRVKRMRPSAFFRASLSITRESASLILSP
jgi:hypothetical protein